MSSLVEAIRADRAAEEVAALVEAKADVNGADEAGMTPLVAACTRGNAATALCLIRARADVNTAAAQCAGDSASTTIMTPLNAAVRSGRVNVVRLLLASGADVRGDCAPLAVAVARNSTDAARALLEAGADANGGRGGATPPVVVCARGGQAWIPMLRLLLSYRASPDACGPVADPALVLACGALDTSVALCLLAHGADAAARAACPGARTAAHALVSAAEPDAQQQQQQQQRSRARDDYGDDKRGRARRAAGSALHRGDAVRAAFLRTLLEHARRQHQHQHQHQHQEQGPG